MKVVLKKNVEDLGRVGEIVNVATGYARNYLFPRRMASVVTKQAMQEAEAARKRQDVLDAAERAKYAGLIERLTDFSCVVTVKANDEGHLFGAVREADIAEVVNLLGIPIEVGQIKLDEPIKILGEYTVPLRFGRELKASIRVVVATEEQIARQSEPEASEGDAADAESAEEPAGQ
ncbi:MAG TPA: 50S ribosomal protein L9 [Candidatus Brocadiia bacterium]|nr:50S ribosomal protein L9 [Candidatus Brocadiia bacterium]